ncbi:hypothetical protein DHL47_00230 [Streptococcus panodentis]|uniref:Uncharacterized protein n=1 Tax=Streptococcus panodentis TaxID=1581472 RepID=A0ABS5AU58_9STRE|nr:hypothetical protein STRDD11_02154 [Streptococcus sp. DD11]MBP2619788.1 hypothetical protein [Streptococcus panodentis]
MFFGLTMKHRVFLSFLSAEKKSQTSKGVPALICLRSFSLVFYAGSSSLWPAAKDKRKDCIEKEKKEEKSFS